MTTTQPIIQVDTQLQWQPGDDEHVPPPGKLLLGIWPNSLIVEATMYNKYGGWVVFIGAAGTSVRDDGPDLWCLAPTAQEIT